MFIIHRSPGKDFHVHAAWAPRDVEIIADVYEHDCYRYRELPPPRYVVDVGAQIGSFSALVHHDHPACKIVACECNPDLIECLRRNVGDFASIVHAAIGYRKDVQLLNAVFPNCKSSGGSIVASPEEVRDIPGYYWADRRPMPTATLEEVIARNNLPYIDILKLDCEGSEWDILWNTTSLHLIRAVVGEWHELPLDPRKNLSALVNSPRFAGWHFHEMSRHGSLGLFWLINRNFSLPAEKTMNDLAASYLGCIALDRAASAWPQANWLELERLLISAGYLVVVVDDQTRNERFQSVTFVSPPREFVDLLRYEAAAWVEVAENLPVEEVFADLEDMAVAHGRSRSLLSTHRLCTIALLARRAASLEGDMAELGVFSGGSAGAIRNAAPRKTLHLFDTFAGLPHDCPEGVHKAGEFACPLEEVREWVGELWVDYRPGVFPATTAGLEDARFCFVHLDADLYESTRDALAFFRPRMVPGGMILLDDVHNPHTPGVARAVREAGLWDGMIREGIAAGLLR